MPSQGLKVCILGSGKWGCAVAKLVGENVSKTSMFHDDVKLYVYEELFDGRKLTEYINSEHTNPIYMPGVKLPCNILAVSNVQEVVKDADIIIFVLRQQFLGAVCDEVKEVKEGIKPSAVGISLTKSLYYGDMQVDTKNELKCASDVIYEKLGMRVSVLMGPNLAEEIARDQFSETTIGCSDRQLWDLWKELFHCSYFKVKFSQNVKAVELCGALKNVVAAAAGLSDGLDSGNSAKAAVIRIGFLEIKRFIKHFTEGSEETDDSIFWEPCGFADLVATCYGGMTRKVVDAFVKSGKLLHKVELELFHGNVLEGPVNVKQVYEWLQERGGVNRYPLLCAVYGVFHQGKPFISFTETLKASF